MEAPGSWCLVSYDTSQLGPATQPKLFESVCHVAINRSVRDEELLSYLTIRHSFGDEKCDG